ncbi:MAG: zinc-binding dehydrogenase, partial [Rhodococcus sp. (in: high G+C Gram-positive bacteria)]
GWGAAVNLGEVRPGDTIIVQGIGGLGSAALQGARHAGATNIVAVDPVAFKREMAPVFGATHTVATLAEAVDVVRPLTNGQGADVLIITVGVLEPEYVPQALAAIRKAGTVVVPSVGKHHATASPVGMSDLTLSQKRLQGCCFGATNGMWDVKRLLDMYRRGQLNLDDMITRTYSLDDISQGYRDMHEGRNIRGVVMFD